MIEFLRHHKVIAILIKILFGWYIIPLVRKAIYAVIKVCERQYPIVRERKDPINKRPARRLRVKNQYFIAKKFRIYRHSLQIEKRWLYDPKRTSGGITFRPVITKEQDQSVKICRSSPQLTFRTLIAGTPKAVSVKRINVTLRSEDIEPL